jgi:hypothetical protein
LVVIDYDVISSASWPDEFAISAAANSLPLYTRNPSDFDALKSIIELVRI